MEVLITCLSLANCSRLLERFADRGLPGYQTGEVDILVRKNHGSLDVRRGFKARKNRVRNPGAGHLFSSITVRFIARPESNRFDAIDRLFAQVNHGVAVFSRSDGARPEDLHEITRLRFVKRCKIAT